MSTFDQEPHAMLAAITTQVGFSVPSLPLRSPHQCQDRVPDGRRQAVPVRDKLLECRVSADMVQPLAAMLDATIMLRKDLRNIGRGCNSRRLHFVCTCVYRRQKTSEHV